MDRPTRRRAPRQPTDRRAHHPHPAHRAARPHREPQRTTHASTPCTMAMGRHVPRRARPSARDPTAHLNGTRAPDHAGPSARATPARDESRSRRTATTADPPRPHRPSSASERLQPLPRKARTTPNRWIEAKYTRPWEGWLIAASQRSCAGLLPGTTPGIGVRPGVMRATDRLGLCRDPGSMNVTEGRALGRSARVCRW